MDIASLIGLLIGMLSLGYVFWEVSHGHLMMFYSLEGVLMVGVGTISVLFMAMPMDKLLKVGGFVKRFMFHKAVSQVQVVQLIGELAEQARKEGILSLESQMKRVAEIDPFMASGLRMTIDGADPMVIESTLRIEIMSMQERHKAGKKFFDLIKLYGPGWALAGTLIGQVGMFGNLEGADVGKLGHMLAIAVCATMYGTILANAIAGPIGDKLALRSADEILGREMVLQGVISIQAGDNPRVTLEKMTAFIPPVGRLQLRAAA